MRLLSVCIPTYEMNSLGCVFLKQSLNVLTKQTFKDFDVVISDHSKTDVIKDLCDKYKDKLDIKYYKNSEHIGSSSANINNAIKKAEGTLIKILFQDDFLYNKDSLRHIVKSFNLKRNNWLVTACEHSKDGNSFYRPFYPRYNKEVYLGNNTIGSPSVLTIKNENPLLFDNNLLWLMDCDYYRRCYDAYGKPKKLKKICVAIRTGDYQVTNTIATEGLRKKEYEYVVNKYDKEINS